MLKFTITFMPQAISWDFCLTLDALMNWKKNVWFFNSLDLCDSWSKNKNRI